MPTARCLSYAAVAARASRPLDVSDVRAPALMATGSDRAADPAALLTALSGLPGVTPDVVRQARQVMVDAMAVGAEHHAFLERQWAIMQATAETVRKLGETPTTDDTPIATSEQLAQARACFDMAVEAVRALSEAANAQIEGPMDEVVRTFRDQLAAMVHHGNN